MEKKFKYLFISRTLTGGGAERFVSIIASHLAKRGEDVTVLLYERSKIEYPLHEKVSVRTMPNQPISFRGKINRISDMTHMIKDIDPDVIIPFIDTVVICAFLANIMLKRKFILTVRVSPWHEGGTKFSKLMRRKIAKVADAIMIQNMEQAEYYPEEYREKTFVVPNPVSEVFLGAEDREYRRNIENIIMVGRIEKQKRFDLMIDATKQLISIGYNVRVSIFGMGSQEKELNEYIEKNGLTEKCKIAGRTTNIEQELRNSDLFVMTSDYEGMPNALMEAMATGIPVISSDCRTGPKTLIQDGLNGLLFKTGDLNDLIENVKKMLDNPQYAEEMGRRARDFMRNCFTSDHTVAAFDDMIHVIF